MSLQQAVWVLRRYWRSILIVAAVVAAVGVAVLSRQVPMYSASASVHFLPKASAASAGQLAASMDFAAAQAKQMASLGKTPVVLDPVIKKLNLSTSADVLASRVTVVMPGEAASVVVLVSDSDPPRAAAVANAIADQIVVQYEAFNPEGDPAQTIIEVRVTSPASVPTAPYSPDIRRDLAVALGIGLAVAVAQAFLRNMVDNRIESLDDVATITSHRVIGEIPFDKDVDQATDDEKSRRQIENFSVRSEAYRRLRTNMQFLALEGRPPSILVTSSIPGEGKTVTVTQVAKAMADAGQKVLLVDADLRRPKVAGYLGLVRSEGLSSALQHNARIPDIVQRWSGVDVVTSGPVPPNPSELLGGDRMNEFIAEAEAAYDVVLIDTPPLLPVTDAVVLGQKVGGSLVLIDTTRVTRNQVRHALRNLDVVKAPVLGLVLNKINGLGDRYGSGYGATYGYSYAYRYDYKAKSQGGPARRASGNRAAGRDR